MYENRNEAGHALVEPLRKFSGKNTIIVAIPKGGAVVGYEVAKELELPLELSLSMELGHQLNPDLKIGDIGLFSRDIKWSSIVSMEYVELETRRLQMELNRIYFEYTQRNHRVSFSGKTVILTDDTIFGGETFLRSVRLINKLHPLRIVAAVPYICNDCFEKVSREVYECIYIERLHNFQSKEEMCPQFQEVTEEEVKTIFFHLKALQSKV